MNHVPLSFWIGDGAKRRGGRALFIGGLGVVWLFSPQEGWAHGDAPVTPETVLGAWNGDPVLLLGLMAAAGVYACGVYQVWRRAGVGNGVRRWQVAAFGGGLCALIVALVSPLEAMAGALFSAHMIQHLILILGAAPLLVLGAPLYVCLWGLPLHWRKSLAGWVGASRLRPLWHGLTHPLVVWGLYAATIWGWHAPPLFSAALHNDVIHEVEHLSFLFAAMAYCWVLLRPMGRRRLSRGVGILYLFTTSAHGSLLGVLIAFAPSPWFAHYVDTAPAWGLSPLQDQQLAGLIMWIPVGVAYAGGAAVLFFLWLKDIKREVHRSEQRMPSSSSRPPSSQIDKG